MTTGLLGVGVSFAEELSGVVTVRGVTTATVGATIVWVASMAMVLTVSQDRPSSRATAATVIRSSISRRRM